MLLFFLSLFPSYFYVAPLFSLFFALCFVFFAMLDLNDMERTYLSNNITLHTYTVRVPKIFFFFSFLFHFILLVTGLKINDTILKIICTGMGILFYITVVWTREDGLSRMTRGSTFLFRHRKWSRNLGHKH